MALEREDLVFCAGTHGVTPFLDRLAPARSAGYAGVSVRPHEIDALRGAGLADAEIRSRIADAGLAVGELDAVTTWLPAHRPPAGMPAGLAAALLSNTAERLAALGEAIGARSLSVVEFYGTTPDPDAAAEAFAGVCDVAARHGLLAHLEFLPWAGIPDLASAWRIVDRAGRANGGLLVDSWHVFRSGSTFEELRAIPGDRVLCIQLDDAPATPEPDLAYETEHRRLLPGRGAIDLVGMIRTLDAIGCRAPLGVEVLSDELLARPVAEAAMASADATRSVVAAARRGRLR